MMATKLKLTSLTLFCGLPFALTLLFLPSPTLAQVVSDGTLPTPTVVDTLGNTSTITGGTRPNGGTNLFHSFSQFDVLGGHTALFQHSADNPATDNIFGRITNGHPSSIFGTVDTATNFPNAGLWLMNPAGFLFGPDATLNVAGAFAAVTANSLNFEDGTKFPAASDATTDGLLNVSNVVAMEFMGTDTPVIAAGSNAAIEVQGLDSQGADVLLVSRDAQSGVGGPIVPGVRINGETKTNGGDFIVGSGNDAGIVGVNAFAPGAVHELGGIVTVNHNNANDTDGRVNVAHATDPSVGGRIVIRSGQFTMEGSNTKLQASVANGANPSIDIETNTSLTIQGGTLSTETTSTHDAGGIRLVSGEITLTDSTLSTEAGGTGAGGPIRIEASEPDTLNIDNSIIVTTVNNVPGGDDPTNGLAPITLTSPTIDIKNGSILWTNTIGSRNAGPITFNVQNLDINGSFIRSTSGAVSPNLGVVLNITDFFVFDLEAALVSPTGKSIILFQNVGGLGNNFVGTTFSDDANTLITNGTAPFSGKFRPQQPFSTFSDGTLSPLVGQWGLIILDDYIFDANGVLQQWSLTFGDTEVVSPNVPQNIDNPFNSLTNFATSTLTVNPNTGAAGNIVVQGLDGPGTEAKDVTLTSSGMTSASFGAGQTGNVSVMAKERVTVSGTGGLFNNALGIGGAGTIEVITSSLELDNSAQIGGSVGQFGVKAADISVHADKVSLDGAAEINSSTLGVGQGGMVHLMTDKLWLANDSRIASLSSSLSTGSSGDITIEGLTDTYVEETNLNDSAITTVTNGSGKAGDLTLHSKQVTIANGSQIATGTKDGSGDGGNLKVYAEDVTITGIGNSGFGSGLIVNSESPNTSAKAGTLTLKATKSVTLSEGGAISGSTQGDGRGADLNITTGVLTLKSGSRISASTAGRGSGGNVTVDASESVSISGALVTNMPIAKNSGIQQGQDSGIFSSSNALGGNAGFIKIGSQGDVTVNDQGTLSTSSRTSGNGGNLEVSAGKDISFTDAKVGAVSLADGNAGNILVAAGGSLDIQNTLITTASLGSGKGGTITLDAQGANTVSLRNTTVEATVNNFDASEGETADNGLANISVTSPNINIDGSTITTQSRGDRNAGGVEIKAINNLNLGGNSTVSAAADIAQAGDLSLEANNILFIQDSTVTSSVRGGSGTEGGDISIGTNSNPAFLILQNSSITTTALFGDGGDVNFNGQVRLIDPFTTIDVSSQFGTSGTVTERGPIQNLSGAIAPLPENIVDIATLVGQHCAAQKGGQLSSFVQAGRDVVPPGPTDFLTSPLFLEPSQAGNIHGTNKGIGTLSAQRLGMALEGEFQITHLLKMADSSGKARCLL